MVPTRLALGVATEHPRDLIHATLVGDHRHVRRGHATLGRLAHHDVVMPPRRDLRQMRDREHLVMRRNVAHRITDHETGAPADPRVDLVEDQRRHAVQAREDRLEREHHARELAS